MHGAETTLGFPDWLRIAHFVNFFFLTLLVRSGIQILSDHPKLYWNDHSHPGSEWISFGKRQLPKGALWTSMDEAVGASPWIALPGERHALGSGRQWHFVSVLFWLLNGFIYVTLLFLTGNWRRLIPTSWNIIPLAYHDFFEYLHFHVPPLEQFTPYDPLQQLAYGSVVFILAPLTILTGLAMSPAISAQFPWFTRIFFGQQKARSLHFLCMVGYFVFFVIHMTMVLLVYFRRNILEIVLGNESGNFTLALSILGCIVFFVFTFNWWATWFTRNNQRAVQNIACAILEPARRKLFGSLTNKQQYSEEEISPFFRINGRPPETEEYLQLMQENFINYRLHIHGLVETPIEISLADLMSMQQESHVTKHVCIQGWTAIAQWKGIPMSAILALCKPLPNAQRVFFHSFQCDPNGRPYYTSLHIDDFMHPRTILAYEMNHQTLPIENGAPLRLRVETRLGFTMCKWIKSIQVVADIKDVGKGHGGYREDYQFYGTESQI